MEHALNKQVGGWRLTALMAGLLPALMVGLMAGLAAEDATAAVLDRTVALVENQAILQSELDQAVAQARRQFESRKQPVPDETSLRRSVLDQMILQRIQLDLVQRAKGQVSDQAVDEALAAFARQQGAPSLEAFEQAVQAQDPEGLTRLRAQIRDRMLLNELQQQTLANRIRITDRDVDNFLASPEGQSLQPTEYHTIHFLITPSASDPSDADRAEVMRVATLLQQGLLRGEPADALIKQHSSDRVTIGGGDMGWHAAGNMNPQLLQTLNALAVGQTSAVLPAGQGQQVLQLVEKRTAPTAFEHQWQVRHILVGPGEGLSDTGAKTRIEQIARQLQGGTAFADLAATYSTDPGSARAGGELGWVSSGQMVAEFEQAMKSTPVGQTSAPFQTQFGWHILQVQGERDQDIGPQKLRDSARQILTQRRMEQELDDWQRELRAGAYVDIRDPALSDSAKTSSKSPAL